MEARDDVLARDVVGGDHDDPVPVEGRVELHRRAAGRGPRWSGSWRRTRRPGSPGRRCTAPPGELAGPSRRVGRRRRGPRPSGREMTGAGASGGSVGADGSRAGVSIVNVGRLRRTFGQGCDPRWRCQASRRTLADHGETVGGPQLTRLVKDHSTVSGQAASTQRPPAVDPIAGYALGTGRPRRSARPGVAPVCSPPSTTTTPLTTTHAIPSGTARLLVGGRRPRRSPGRRRRCRPSSRRACRPRSRGPAAPPARRSSWTAVSRDSHRCSRTNSPRMRGNEPHVRGDGFAPTNIESVPTIDSGCGGTAAMP